MERVTVNERLEIFAEEGISSGFTLNLWPNQVKKLRAQGIGLSNPVPTGRKGEMSYTVDFSAPITGTRSEYLYQVATAVKPVPPPYSQD